MTTQKTTRVLVILIALWCTTTFAIPMEIPPLDVTIKYVGPGINTAYQTIEAVATGVGLTCTPTVEDYAQGKIIGARGKPVRWPQEMRCGLGESGTIAASTELDGHHGRIRLRAYYELPPIPKSVVKPKIDALVVSIESKLKSDPQIESIDQTMFSNGVVVVSTIK
jgi:hypothetical protein